MKGLLIKDLQFMLNQKIFFLFIIILGITLSFTTNSVNFLIGYTIFFLCFFTLNTITYDETDNGFAFLFTLPISRKSYVLEKYIYGIILTGFAGVIATTIGILINPFFQQGTSKDILITGIVCFTLGCFFLLLNIPIHLRFRGEKAQLVLTIIGITFFAFIVYCGSIGFFYNETFLNIVAMINSWSIVLRAAIVFVIFAASFIVSYFISVRILNKKEF